MDASTRHIKNGSVSINDLASGGYAASRWGIRTSEDLGGGYSAGGWLEGTVNVDTGTPNATRYWNRRSTVSLQGPQGELRIGRDLIPGYTAFGEFDTFIVSGLADQGKFYSTAFNSGLEKSGTWARADNMVSYYTPRSLGGFYANLAYAFGEGVVASRYRGARVGYADGPLNISASAGSVGAIGGDFERTSIAATYDFGTVKLFGSAVKNKYLDASRLISQAGVWWRFSGANSVRANVTQINTSGRLAGQSIAADDARQVGLGYVYDFSKRTLFYATYVNIRNRGDANFSVIGTSADARGLTSSGLEMGVSHRF